MLTTARRGWGEAWCNFPGVGAEHRARLVDSVFAPIATGRPFESPRALFEELTRATAVLAIQCGEPGPIAQSIAAIDLAAWDLVARRAGMPLWRLLGGTTDRVAVYASGLNPDGPERLAVERRTAGHTRFKLKVGFGEGRDLANLRALRESPRQRRDVDESTPTRAGHWRRPRPWSASSRHSTCSGSRSRCAPTGRGTNGSSWPTPVPCRWPQARTSPVATRSRPRCPAARSPSSSPMPPSGAASAATSMWSPTIAAAGRRYCPHFLGGGVGLLASAHLLAGTGGDGWLEIDANPNPLRSLLEGPIAVIDDGTAVLGDAPGIGIDRLPAEIERFRVGY